MQEVLVESMEFEVNGGNNSNFNTHDVVDDNDNYKKYYDVDVDHMNATKTKCGLGQHLTM